MRILILTFVVIITNNGVAQSWMQKGSTLHGEYQGGEFGGAVAFNEDGNILAVGEFRNNDSATAAGKVRVYEWNGTEWEQKGADINGSTFTKIGTSMDLSADGNILVIGASGPAEIGMPSGHARVYEWSGEEWIQKGGYIESETFGDDFAAVVDMNDAGDIIVIGGPHNDDVGISAGNVRVYGWDDDWVQLGENINGEHAYSFFGGDLAINAAGTTIAVGARGGGADNQGTVHVFDWVDSEWILKGEVLTGVLLGDQFGTGVAMDASGNKLAIGAIGAGENGKVYVYFWNDESWEQLGIEINSAVGAFHFGAEVAMNDNGNFLAVGDPLDQSLELDMGLVTCYQWNGESWISYGSAISGIVSREYCGRDLVLNGDGTSLAVGSPFVLGGEDSDPPGYARVFEFAHVGLQESIGIIETNIYPNPANNFLNLELNMHQWTETVLTLRDLTGNTIDTRIISEGNGPIAVSIPVDKLAVGTYFLEVENGLGKQATKFVKW